MVSVHRLRLLIAAALVLVLVLTLEASPAAGATRNACRVKNSDSGRAFGSLQAAVKVAKSGDKLILTGTCHGKSVIDKSLVIEGVRTRNSGTPTLTGDRQVRVVSIEKGVRVRLVGLVIRDGNARKGGGVLNRGRLTLRDVTVRLNTDPCCGGVRNVGVFTLKGTTSIKENTHGGVWNVGTLTMYDTSSISRNRGIGVVNKGTLTLNEDSSISQSGNGGVWNDGLVTLNGSSSVRDNKATKATEGAGVTNWYEGVLVTNDASTISGNRAIRGGGGVANYGVFTLNGSSSVSDNVAERGSGGGVANYSTLVLNDNSRISGNATKRGGMCDWCGGLCLGYDCPGVGGGVYSEGAGAAILMTGTSAITGNFAGKWGAGVLCNGLHVPSGDQWKPLLLTMVDSAVITGNTATDHGGGIFVAGRVSLDGVYCAPQSYANVYGNAPDDCYVYVE